MKLAHVPIALAALSALALVASGFGARYGVWDWRFGFQLVRWSFYAGLAAAALALVALIVRRIRAGHALGTRRGARDRPRRRVSSMALDANRACAPVDQRHHDRHGEPARIRCGRPVARRLAGADDLPRQPKRRQSSKARYPDIRPLELAMPPDAAFARALDAAKSFGWEIDATDAASGRIEATATTPWFGFRDDVVIRVTPTPSGSRIDVRSLSRVGKGDVGANAKRIRAYLAKLSG